MRTIPFSDALLGDTPIMATFAKAALKGLPLVFEPCHYTRAIQALADRSFPASLSKQQRFSRALDLPEGRLLLAASKQVPGSEIFPQSEADEPGDDEHFEASSAYAELEVLARDLMLANPHLTEQQAFSRIYTSPKNRALRERAIREATMRATASTTTKAAPVDAAHVQLARLGRASAAIEALAKRHNADHPGKVINRATPPCFAIRATACWPMPRRREGKVSSSSGVNRGVFLFVCPPAMTKTVFFVSFGEPRSV